MAAQVALAQTPCELAAAQVSESHKSKMDSVESRFDLSRAEIKGRQLSKFKDAEKRKQYRQIQEQLIKRARIAAVREDHSKHLFEGLDNLKLSVDPEQLCDDTDIYWKSSEQRVKSFEEKLANLNEELVARYAIESLGRKEGLAIIAVFVHGLAEKIHLNKRGSLLGGMQIGPISNDQYFRVVKLPAGEYNWSRVTRGNRYHDFRKSDLSFKVEAGKLNYTGVFMYEQVNFSLAKADVNDRTSIVMEIMESRHPDLLERYEIKNGLVLDDRFLEFYTSEKARLGGAAR